MSCGYQSLFLNLVTTELVNYFTLCYGTSSIKHFAAQSFDLLATFSVDVEPPGASAFCSACGMQDAAGDTSPQSVCRCSQAPATPEVLVTLSERV